MATVSIVLSVIAGVGVMVLLFKPLFGDKEGFIDCVKFWFTPDIFSFFSGEYFEDRWSERQTLRFLSSRLKWRDLAANIEHVKSPARRLGCARHDKRNQDDVRDSFR